MKRSNRVLGIILLALALAAGMVGLALAQEGDPENGKKLFGEYCAVCHGYDGRGRVGADLSGWFGGIDPEAFVRATVSDGIAGNMPAFAQANGGPLTEQEIDDIAAYILSWKQGVEPAPTPTPVPVTPIPTVAGVLGDPTAGARTYARNCRLCHGEQGQGGIGATLSGPIAAAQPAAFLRETINDGVKGSPMPAFRGALSPDEIENVIAYILSWEHKPPLAPTPTAQAEGEPFNALLALAIFLVALLLIGGGIVRFSRRTAAK